MQMFSQTWKQVEPRVIQNSVGASGFGKCNEWMIWKHDGCGNNFQHLCSSRETMETNKVEQKFEELGFEEGDKISY